MAGIRHASLDTAVDRLLAPVARPTERPKAIFRVVPAAEAFQFTRRLFGAASSGLPVIERFGPFESERAAHALAKRAAVRFQAERPQFVVGVIGLAEEDRPQTPGRFRAEGFAATETREPPKCLTCGKPTRIFASGRRQLYCPKVNGGRNLCAEAGQERKYRDDPQLRAERAERHRRRYHQRLATPEARAQMRVIWRQRYAKEQGRQYVAVEDQELAGVVPKCEICGKPTRFYHGKAVRFCSKVDGKPSKCMIKHTNSLYEERMKADPELKSRKNKRSLKGYYRNKSQKRTESLPSGSVLVTASPRGDGYDLFSRIHAAVPSNMPPSLRAEIISETAVLVLEGAEIPAAVTQATKSVRKNGSRLRWAKPIEDCFWLADETQQEMEHC